MWYGTLASTWRISPPSILKALASGMLEGLLKKPVSAFVPFGMVSDF